MKSEHPFPSNNTIRLFLAGDVMTGRGIDQVLPYPGDHRLYEPYVKDARDYIELAEQTNGIIPQPVPYRYIWGNALNELERANPDVRIINLETSITSSLDHWPGKGIHYKMHPDNIASLTEAGISYTSLANNHILDWGYTGLVETLETLTKANIGYSGAGVNLDRAMQPEIIRVEGKGRVIIYSWGTPSSGIPDDWAAGEGKPGINFLPDLTGTTIRQIKENVSRIKREGDIVVASLHWESNWGYDIPASHIQFAHRLLDEAGVNLIHGHSSHHPRPLEVHNGKLIIYGAGDFINDYEGITGHEAYRGDLALMYFVDLDPSTGRLIKLQMKPLIMKQFKLHHAPEEDTEWLKETLNRESRNLGTHLRMSEDNALVIS